MSDRRMIEDFIPVEAISYESAREKVARRRNGHLSTLHLWWARRPLAACRAAVYATFAPPAADRSTLPGFFEQLCHWTGPILPESPALKLAHQVVSTAANGERPRVLDPFAGGGAIPLEALRLGAQAVAVELNPVAHLIQLCTLRYPQLYGQRLRDAVAQWGAWVIARTQADLGDLYADLPVGGGEKGTADLFTGVVGKAGLRPIAYLWTRTIPSPAPGFEAGLVPLVRQTWLRKKKNNYVALRPVVDRAALTVRYEVVESRAGSEAGAIAEWGFDPAGMSVRGATTCPYSGAPVTAADVKAAGKAGRLGQQMMAVVCVTPGARGKVYRGAEAVAGVAELDARAAARVAALCAATGLTVPEEELPEKLTGGMCTIYGLDKFGDLFTPRQQLLLLTLCHHTLAAHERLAREHDPDFATAVGAYLGLLVGRMADRASVLCRWHNVGEKTENTYARQALPMVWDFSEPNPFGGGSGDLTLALGLITDVLDHLVAAGGLPAELHHGRAQRLPIEDESIHAVITDPPYYDNISYADLSDFFYVWHKRALGRVMPGLYVTAATPKKAEAVAAPQRHGGDKAVAATFYETEMRKAFAEAHRVLKPGCPLVCVYAHKTTLGWSTLVDSLRSAGFQVTEAWPLNTEMPDRAGQMDTASLASSIFIIARKRPTGTGTGNHATDVLPALTTLIETRVRDLMAAGVTGADLVIATVGAGLAPFTRFDRVELPNGDELTAERYLDTVQREVLEVILAAVFALDRSGVRQIDVRSRFYVLARLQHAGPVEFGELNILAQGVGVELAGHGGLSEGRQRLVALEKSTATVLDFARRGPEPELGQGVDGQPAPLIDVLHRLVWLHENDRMQTGDFLRTTKPDLDRLRLLAHALKGRTLADGSDTRTEEQKALDRLLVQWPRVVEGAFAPMDRGGDRGGAK